MVRPVHAERARTAANARVLSASVARADLRCALVLRGQREVVVCVHQEAMGLSIRAFGVAGGCAECPSESSGAGLHLSKVPEDFPTLPVFFVY